MKKSRNQSSSRLSGIFSDDKGAIAAWFALFLPVFIGIGALALDISYTMMLRQKLQVTASSAALAGAAGLVTDQTEALNQANLYADFNAPQAGDVMIDDDIDTGCFDFATRNFDDTCAVDDHDAVKVFARLSDDANYNNPVSLFLAGIFGMDQTNINVTATAVALRNQQPDACMIALNPSPDEQGIKLGGISSISASKDCGICVNSTSTGDSHNTAAMGANGSPSVIIGSIGDGADVGVGGIIVAGNYEEVGNVQMNPDPENTDMLASDSLNDPILCPDPYAFPFDPGPDPCVQALDGTTPRVASGIQGVADGTPLNESFFPIDPPPLAANIEDPFNGGEVPGLRYPGDAVYCSGITINGGTPIEFGAGEIFIVDELRDDVPDLNINGVSGGGDFISTEVWDCDEGSCGGSTFVFMGSLLDINNSSSVNLTGNLVPKKDANGDDIDPITHVPGDLFRQDPNMLPLPQDPADATFHKITGGSEFYLNGLVHMGMEDLWLRGSIASDETYDGGCLTLLAGTFDMNGTVDLNINTEGCGTIDNVGPATYSVRLVD